MTRTIHTLAAQPTQESINREPESRRILLEHSENNVLVPCILLLPPNAIPILSLFQNLAPAPAPQASPESTMQSTSPTQPQGDSWLPHSEAAEYLGVARTTLYHYVGEERIESRKIGGRLQYRLSALEKFKEEQIRPARRAPDARSIIAPALGSGK